LAEDRLMPGVSIRGAFKIPTGDFDQAFGSGKPDIGFGLAMEKQISGNVALYINQNVVVPDRHLENTDLTLNPIETTAIALEFRWTSQFSIEGQFDYYTSPFHETGSHTLNLGTAEAVFGFNYQTKSRILWQLYMIENFENPVGSAADFSIGTNIISRFY